MVIRDDQKRTMTDSFLRQLRNNFVANRLGRRCNVVDRNDQEIFRRTRRRDNGQKLRGHSRCHFAKFSTSLPAGTSAKCLACHSQDEAEFFGRQRHDRQPRLSDQCNLFELRLRFDLRKRYRFRQRFDRNKIDCAPIAFLCRRVPIRRARHFGNANDRFLLSAVIKQYLIAFGHAPKTISGRKIANSGPTCAAISNKI